MIVFRHADPRFPFLWETAGQPAARWHREEEGPVQYFADTPNGAWAELLRHEEIRSAADLAGLRRALWAIELPDAVEARPDLPLETLTGPPETYESCRREAKRLQAAGHSSFRAPSAALLPGGAGGWRVEEGRRAASPRDGEVLVMLGRRPDLVGWPAVLDGSAPAELLERVRHF